MDAILPPLFAMSTVNNLSLTRVCCFGSVRSRKKPAPHGICSIQVMILILQIITSTSGENRDAAIRRAECRRPGIGGGSFSSGLHKAAHGSTGCTQPLAD